MSSQVETLTGRCPTHGNVEAEREIPRMGFPFIYFAILRALARKRPYRCPDCSQPVTV